MTCTTTGRVYIGITIQPLRKRLAGHFSQAKTEQTKLSRAIRKYGRQAFVMEWIASSWDFESLLLLEVELIAQYDSQRNGLNSTIGGEGVRGRRHTDAAKARMALSRKKVWTDPGYREAITAAQKEAWTQKDEYERAIHSIRARETLSQRAQACVKPERIPGPGKGWNMAKREECKQGHPYVEGSFRRNKHGARICLVCKRKTRNIARDRKRRELRERDPLI